jgi:putative endopeptidase
MRAARSVLVALTIVLTSLVQAQDGQLRGIEVADISRSADACTDFYEFANGRWRSENPIPPAMPRWSRRWAAGETAKDRLHELLDDASRIAEPPKGSIDQLIGDLYGACTNETQANALGVKPVARCWPISARSATLPAFSG